MIPLLPYEKKIAQVLGVSEESFHQWKAITLQRSIQRPAASQGPVCGPLVPVLANLAIAVGATLLSSLLFPGRDSASRINVKRSRRSPSTSNQRLSPRFGFDSSQEPAQVGQFIPIIIAKRENGLGGVRVAMPLLWSQMLAQNGSTMFRGIFLAGGADMPQDAWDPRGWAFGNNTLGAYAYTGTALARGARYSIYFRRNGGRIVGSDLIAGRQADRDPGNFQNRGGGDVFSVAIGGSDYRSAFCMVESPAQSTAFGLYNWCPNAMVHREMVTLQPTILARVGGGDIIRTDDDASALLEVWKGKFYWTTFSGLRQYRASGSLTWTTPASSGFTIVTQSVAIGDSLRYVLHKGSDVNTRLKIDEDNSRVEVEAEVEEAMEGVAAAVAALQNSADAALIPNELYMIGTCWAILEERISENSGESIFVSTSEQEPAGGGNTMTYEFTVVQPGEVQFIGEGFLGPPDMGDVIRPPSYNPNDDLKDESSGTEGRYKVCSEAAQIFRLAIASVGAVREYRTCEAIIKSKVGINISSVTNFRSCPKVKDINAKAGQNQVGNTAGGVLAVSRYNSNNTLVSVKTRRYSTFALQYSLDRGASWTQFPDIFAVVGVDGEDTYNYLRLHFPYAARWEWRLVPLPSWQIRSLGVSQVFVLDTNTQAEISTTANNISVYLAGYVINPTVKATRAISQLDAKTDIGLGWTDEGLDSMFDGYARFAEAFAYGNLQTSVGNAPEHSIQHVNFYGDLNKTPSYSSLALTGANVSGGPEISTLPSFSGFCNNGYEMPRLLNNDTKGSTHLFPDWLRELMTSPELGALPSTQPAEIDATSFREAAQWCQDRQYFYDAVEGEPLNILDWGTRTAQAHLLKLVKLGGVYHLKKAIEFDAALKIDGQFNNGNIEEGSFKLNSIGYQARQPFAVQVKWREESAGAESPLFARERVATVREAGTSINAPVRELDLSAWCTNYKQAIDAACYLIRFVTLNDHEVELRTTPDVLAARLYSGGFFSLDVDVISYNTAFQGFIQANGKIVSTRPWLLPLSDGYHTALTWDMETDPQERTIVIEDGLADLTNVFFAIRSSVVRPRIYEIEKVNIGAKGVVTVNAFHHPVNEDGFSLLGVNWTTYVTDSNWIIEL